MKITGRKILISVIAVIALAVTAFAATFLFAGTRECAKTAQAATGDVLEVTVDGTATTYADFATGWNAAVDAGTATVKLLDNVDNTVLTVESGNNITLDLNGFTINRNLTTATSNGYVIIVNGNLTLTDNSLAKTGVITGGNTTGSGGGVYVNKTFTMQGGKIRGNTANSKGGGVFVNGSGTFTMSGGTITGNTATNNGGGVYVSGDFNLSGDATITGNKVGVTNENVYLPSTTKINITAAFTGTVGVAKSGKIATGFTETPDNKASARFQSDDPTYNCVYVSDRANGTVTIATHNFEYSYYDSTSHTKSCRECGYIATDTEEHAFNLEVVNEEFLCDPATCKRQATYFKSCVCGARSDSYEETFSAGELAPHNYNEYDGLCSECGAPKPIYWWIDGGTLKFSNTEGGTTDKKGSFPFDYPNADRSESEYNYTDDTNCYMPAWWEHRSEITKVVVGGADDIIITTSTSHWFCNLANVTEIDLSGLNSSAVTNMQFMFRGCSSLTSIDGLSRLDTTLVTNMRAMFSGCSSLTDTLDVSSFKTSRVGDMFGMFYNCNKLTEIKFKKSPTENNFQTYSVFNMGSMFGECKSLTSLDLSGFDTSTVTNGNDMFSGCTSLKTINAPNNVSIGNSITLPNTYWCASENYTGNKGVIDEECVRGTLTLHPECSGGGENSCARRPVCVVCEKEYGEIIPHNFVNAVCTGCEAHAVAEVTIGNIVSYYADMASAFDAANAAGTATIKMLEDATVTSNKVYYEYYEWLYYALVVQEAKDITLDLNDKVLKYDAENSEESGSVIVVLGTFTLVDNAAVKTQKTVDVATKIEYDSQSNSIITDYGQQTLITAGGVITGGCNSVANGGAVLVENYGTFNMAGGIIAGNVALSSHGGGVAAFGKFNMTGGEISYNACDRSGGGVYEGGTFNMSGGKICNNSNFSVEPDESNPYYGGGGIAVNYNCTISENAVICDNYSKTYGGGVVVKNSGSLTLNGGVISGNRAIKGGGVALYTFGNAPEFVMNGGEISGNSATYGGGVGLYKNYAYSSIAFDMSNGKITGNSATDGGGVYVYSVDNNESYYMCTFTMTGGEISTNQAENGAGVCVNNSNLIMSDGKVSGNEATVSGGGILATIKIDGEATPTQDGKCQLYIYGSANVCNNQGGNLYLEKNIKLLFNDGTANKEFTEGVHVGVTLAPDYAGAFTQGYAAANAEVKPSTVLFSDDNSKCAKIETNEVTFAPHAGGAATCLAPKQCDNCGQGYGELGSHDFGEWDNGTPATAESEGVKAHKDCSVCNKHFDQNGEELTDLVIPKRIMITVEGGAIDGTEESSVTVDKHGTVTVIAEQKNGKVFKGWSIDGGETVTVTDESYTFNATENLTLTAVYEDIPAPAKGLSGGAIAGITIGSVLLAVIALYGVGLILYKKQIIDWKICKILYFFIAD